MKYVENGVPEDANKITFADLSVPLCELGEEEYKKIVFGVDSCSKKHGCEDGFPKSEFDNDPIEILELSVRATNCLLRTGIDTVGKLRRTTEIELSQIRSMGAKSVDEVKAKLRAVGLELKS